MGRSAICWFLLTISTTGCNPFRDKGGEGEACKADGTCLAGLTCDHGVCVSVDCDALASNCDRAGLPNQGPDLDSDGWGLCCDCDDARGNIRPDAAEVCDNEDNNCDTNIDEGGVCDPPCDDYDLDGYGAGCPAGEDCDDSSPGIHPGAQEVCNGYDDDCDGRTDEDVLPLVCPLIAGVCAGSMQICQPDGSWSDCDYGADHDPDQELRCDGLDNDCDGQTDENVLVFEPEAGAQAADGLDNNCNGLVDEAGGLMVPHPSEAGIWIDAYEASIFDTPDCEGTRYGIAADDYPAGWPAVGQQSLTLYACSLANTVPSGHLSWYRAERACTAQSKRLCARQEWAFACNGGGHLTYPYGPAFIEGACNDALAGTGAAEPTGTFPICTATPGTWDMSGNLAEWVQNNDEEVPQNKMTGGHSYDCQICDEFGECRPCQQVDGDYRQMAEAHDCFIRNENYSFVPETAKAWFGVRCCYPP